MFCPYCGAAAPDDSLFCISCGKQLLADQTAVIQSQMQMFQLQKQATRQSEIQALTDTYQHFARKSDQFKRYERVCSLVNHYAKGSSNALIIWGCIVSTLGYLITMALISLSSETSLSAASLPFILFLDVPGILMLIGGIALKINCHKKLRRYKQEYAYLSQELYDYYIAYTKCPVGPEYVNPEILEQILNVLQSGRADTIKEAINLLVSGINQVKIEKYLEAIRQNTASTNAHARNTAIFVAASFFR